MSQVLLTGGTGYIGSHTAVELLKQGLDVVIADDLSNSSASVIDRVEMICGKRPAFYEIDITDKKELKRVFDENDISAVIHFAAKKAVGESVRLPLKYYRNNIDGILTVLEVMKEHGCRRFVFSSSATVYGDSPVPFTEGTPLGKLANPYGRTKYMCEEILRDEAAAEPECSFVILRYFNPIGADASALIGEDPRRGSANIMPNLVLTAAGIKEKLSVFGTDYPTPDGSAVRDYIHISDLAEGHLAALRYAEENRGCEVFNLGTGRGSSVLELIESFERVNDLKLNVEYAPRREGDVPEMYAATDKAERVLGWKAKRGIDDMCRSSWLWGREVFK